MGRNRISTLFITGASIWTMAVGTIAAASPAVLISDIDDTLKQTHVLDFIDLARYGLSAGAEFYGLAKLINRWRCHEVRARNTQDYVACLRDDWAFQYGSGETPDLYYVTAATSDLSLDRGGRLFLEHNHYPSGKFVSKQTLFSGNPYVFKLSAIEPILEKYPSASAVVLLGDNGQSDPLVFDELRRRLRSEGLPLYAFVHLPYSRDTTPDLQMPILADWMVPWLTALDLGLSFLSMGWIAEDELLDIAEGVVTRLASANAKLRGSVLPDWADCRDYWRSYRRPLVTLSERLRDTVERFEGLIQNRCAFDSR